MNLYVVISGGDEWYVEALTMGQAIDLWQAAMYADLGESPEDPEIVMMVSERRIIGKDRT